ncbi:sphingomyelin phosphodiesterase 5-like isoform X1 [Eublepharis macularius]|uniref:sphingomyelin phosphodiesterase n=1 Tax=Eublepharis macularius TaxID=481883 RepID=A0AA97L2S0_EUBMA|nr:sphingomyelin phosphodiesterase 5-like isoform X1 [Eublepharis macularius]
MGLRESPYSSLFLGGLDALARDVLYPSYWLLNQLLALKQTTAEQQAHRSQRWQLPHALHVLALGPLLLLLLVLYMPLSLLGFLLWLPLQATRRPFAYLHTPSQASPEEWLLPGKGKAFQFISSNVCLLPEGLAKFSNLAQTQKRAVHIAQALIGAAGLTAPAHNVSTRGSIQNGSRRQTYGATEASPPRACQRSPRGDTDGTAEVPLLDTKAALPREVTASFPPDLDFLCMQEVFDRHAAAHLLQILAPCYEHIVYDVGTYGLLGCSALKLLNSGLFLASRYPLLAVQYHCYPNGRGEDAFAAKGLLCVQVRGGFGGQGRARVLRAGALSQQGQLGLLRLSGVRPGDLARAKQRLCHRALAATRTLSLRSPPSARDSGIGGTGLPEQSNRECFRERWFSGTWVAGGCACSLLPEQPRLEVSRDFPEDPSPPASSLWVCSAGRLRKAAWLLGAFSPRLPCMVLFRDPVAGRMAWGGHAGGAHVPWALEVQLGVSQGQRIVGYLNCTHLHAPEHDAQVRCEQLTLALRWTQLFQDTHTQPGDLVAFDVFCGDLNFDNCSPDDKVEQDHEIFNLYTDPCRIGPGQDQPWALGTLLNYLELYDEAVAMPETMRRTLECAEGREKYLAGPILANVRPGLSPSRSEGRRIDYILYREHHGPAQLKTVVESVSYITQLASCSDHIPVGLRLLVSPVAQPGA